MFIIAAVTYISSSNSPPTRYLITLCKVSYVSDLKAALCKMAGLDSPEHLVVAEVFDNHIARIVVRFPSLLCKGGVCMPVIPRPSLYSECQHL